MSQLFRRLRYLLNRRRFDEELAGDMAAHREMAGERFGNTLRLREEARDAWGWTWIDRLSQDLRYAARKLRHSPGFTTVAVLMLAIGIGVNVAAFGFFNLMFLRPFSVRDPDTLLRLKRRAPQNYASNLPYPEMAFIRKYSKTLSAVMGLADGRLVIQGEPKPADAYFVTPNLFSELGAAPRLGRLLDPVRDGAADAEPVVVLGEGFWQRHFGGDPGIVGKTIRMNGHAATVIGVVPHEFSGLTLSSADLWIPISQQPGFVTGSHLLTDYSVESPGVRTFGRLRPGLTPKAAEDEMRSLVGELKRQQPVGIWDNEWLRADPGAYASGSSGSHHGTGTEDRNEAWPVIALVGTLSLLILGVACANLGTLLLARGVVREREIAIRVSVGAGKGRLIRQLFTESLLLSLLGSAAGLLLGYVVLRALMVLSDAPAWLSPAPDWRVAAFAVAMGFTAAVVFGLTPALQGVRQKHKATLTRQILVGAQVAASCVLLILAGLLVRALDRAMSTSPGFEYRQVVLIDPSLEAHGYSPAEARTYLDSLQSRLGNVPGVESVSFASTPPLGNMNVTAGATIDGHAINMHVYDIGPQFFQTMTIPLLRGRYFTAADTHSVVVGESLARLAWPGQDPLGKQLPLGDIKYNVVGVVGSARLVAIQDSDAIEAYFLAGSASLPSMVALVKTNGPPDGLVSFMASVAKSIDPRVFPQVQLLKNSFEVKMQGAEKSALVVSALGLVALLLACMGIAGVVAFAVSQRTKELGIRMALGAKPGNVLSVVMRQFSRPVVIGLLTGTGLAAGLSKILRSGLYGISNLDPAAYLGAVGLFIATVGVAALLPARRALGIEPLRALRHD